MNIEFIGGPFDGASRTLEVEPVNADTFTLPKLVGLPISGVHIYTLNTETGKAHYTPTPDPDIEMAIRLTKSQKRS